MGCAPREEWVEGPDGKEVDALAEAWDEHKEAQPVARDDAPNWAREFIRDETKLPL